MKLFGNLHSITNLIKVDPRHLFSSASKNLQKPGAFTSYPKFVRRPMSANSPGTIYIYIYVYIGSSLPSAALSFIENLQSMARAKGNWQLLFIYLKNLWNSHSLASHDGFRFPCLVVVPRSSLNALTHTHIESICNFWEKFPKPRD